MDYLMDVWTGDNGLPDSSVTAIVQTPDGYLWVGTYNGLVRFDGARFVTFDPLNTPALKHARVDGLFVDPQGTLWVNTRDGSMTSWRNGVFTNEWQGGQVSAVFMCSNQLFFALLRGQLVCRTGNLEGHGEWQSIPLGGTTAGHLFRQDRAGILWYATRDGTLNWIIGTNSETVSSKDYLNGEKVNCLTTDESGQIWVGTEKRILLWMGDHFEDRTPTNGEPVVNASFIACTVSNGCWVIADGKVRKCMDRRWVAEAESWQKLSQADAAFLRAYEDRDGGIWIRQYGQGLFHANPDGSTQRVSAADGLPDNRVGSWFQDHEGNVWVGVDRGGLVRLREKRFQVIGTAEGLSIPAVSTVCEDADTNIWVGTFGGGLNRLHDGKLSRFELSEGIDKGNFFSAYPDAQGRLWVSAGREDLFLFEAEKFSQPVRPAPVHGTKVILVDHRGKTWVGKQSGLACISNGAVTNFGTWNGFDRKDIRALAEDRQGNIWIGTGSSGLFKLSDGIFTSYPVKDSLGNQAIWSLLPEADDTLWIGTFRGGLLRLKDGKFTRYTEQDGLPSDIICQILDDGFGKLWIGSHKGVFYVPKVSFKDYDAGKIQSLPCVAYGLYDGLPTLECSGNYQPTCWRGHDGRLWFATAKGLVSVLPGELSVNRRLPPVIIEEMLVDGKAITTASASQPYLVSPGKHQLDFRYTALSFIAPDKVRFRYRLVGLDDTWVEAEGKRSAHYGPLRPGEYSFKVIACNNDGIWNETGATVKLKLLPHFWETWWFAFSTITAAVILLVFTVRYIVKARMRKRLERLEQAHAIQLERQRIARDIHDDLGAGLTQILLQSSLASRETSGQTRTDLSQISDNTRELVRKMDEIVWAVTPEKDTLESLVTYVGKFVQEFCAATQLRCRMDLPAQLPDIAVSTEIRHSLFLAVKESMNNIAKHAGATEVSIQFMLQPDSFTFVISDNGVGLKAGNALDQDRIFSGQGLRNLAQRLGKIGGTYVISASPGGGTQVRLNVQMNHKP
jgi:ligand-binding sensor domain-containing protein/signal transduction histidine kinase